ncbi:MAG: FIST N-terminal domain-containing protein [Phycisphaerales bacterium]|jgi:small ligand-binding sensory domain FIST|nr:FIST N-terminal domain-containing protein [Phycisphaerales bacterium]
MHAPPTEFQTQVVSDRHADTRTAALSLAGSLREELDGPPAALLVAASFHHSTALPEAVRTIRDALDGPASVGFTARSVMAGPEEFESGPSMVAMAIGGPRLRIRSFHFDHRDGPPEAWSRELVRSRLRPMSPPRGLLVFADPFTAGSDALPARLAATLPAGVPISGGLLSGASQAGANVLVADDAVSMSGAVGLIFEGDIELEPIVAHGCRGVGESLIVTGADGSSITSLGGRPAAEVLEEVLGSLSGADRTALARTPLIGIAADAAKPIKGRGDFLIRPIGTVDRASGNLLLSGGAPRGSTVRFQVRDAAIAAEDLGMSLDLAVLDHRPAAGVILSSSAGRGSSLFGSPGHDAGRIHERLADPPLLGFVAAAEIASIGGRPRLAGLGLSAVVLRGVVRP